MIGRLKPKSEFSRNVLTLMTGTTLAQALPIAISPLLTRLYSPQDFGIFALFMSLASILSLIATGRYELAIMLPKKDNDAFNLMALSFFITIAVSFFSFLIVFFFNHSLTQLLGDESISKWLYWIPLSVLLTGIYQIFNYWLSRKKEYKKVAISRVTQTGTTATSNLAMGTGTFGSSGLILGSLIGQGLAAYTLAKPFQLHKEVFLQEIQKLKMIALMKKYKKLPIYNLPNALLDGVRLSGISILIAKLFATSTLGQFSLAWKMVQTPMALLGGSLSQVFFQKVSSCPKEELYATVKKFILKSSFIAAPIFLFIYFFSVDIFTFVFGKNWSMAGEAASIMAPWLFLNFITSALSTLFITLNKQEILLLFSVLYMAIPLSILFLLSASGFLATLQIVTLCMSLLLLLFIVLVLYFTKQAKGKK